MVYEKIEVTRHRNVTMLAHQEVTSAFTIYIVAAIMEQTQSISITTYVFFKVTICLYLSPSNRARSLSMLIAVNVSKDTEHRTLLIIDDKCRA